LDSFTSSLQWDSSISTGEREARLSSAVVVAVVVAVVAGCDRGDG
jgi:hypothetical protein